MADVFISYRRTERETVLRIRDAFERLNVSVWFDARLEAGESFSKEITREARGATAILVCWSPEAAKSDWVQAEALIGVEEGKLIACAVKPIDAATLEVPFNSKQTIDLNKWRAEHPHSGWTAILARLGALINRPGLAQRWELDYQLASLSAGEQVKALEDWVVQYANDPLAEQTWSQIEQLETEENRRRIAERKAKAAATVEAARPAPPTAHEVQARRDAAQGKAWRELGGNPSEQMLREFVQEWKNGPLVDLANRHLRDLTANPGAPTPSPSHFGSTRLLVTFAIVILGGFLIALGVMQNQDDPTDQTAWAFASDLNTERAYEHYLDRFPKGAFANNARAAMNSLAAEQDRVRRATDAASAWQAAQISASEAGYQQFVEDWPESEFSDAARQEIERIRKDADDRAWEEAQNSNRVEAYEAYKQAQPNGRFSQDADKAIEALKLAIANAQSAAAAEVAAWQTAQSEDTIAAYRSYLSTFADGNYSELAMDRIAGLESILAAKAAALDAETNLASADRIVERFEGVASAGRCEQQFVIYFDFNSNSITTQGAAVLNQAISNVRNANCEIEGVLIQGHSDTSGSRSQAFVTARRRADAVRDYLVNVGVSSSKVQIASFGEERPAKTTGDGVREPLNRRAEVTIKATPSYPPFSMEVLHPDVREAVEEARAWELKGQAAVAEALEAEQQALIWETRQSEQPDSANVMRMAVEWSSTIRGETEQINATIQGQRAGSPTYRVTEFLNGRSIGDRILGAYSGNRPEGPVVYRYAENPNNPEGSYYHINYMAGRYSDGQMNGAGGFFWESGRKYLGQFAEGKRTGFGRRYSRTGAVSEGIWQDTKLNGLGVEWTNAGQLIRQGRFESGRLVEAFERP